jgi:hypothetical protein
VAHIGLRNPRDRGMRKRTPTGGERLTVDVPPPSAGSAAPSKSGARPGDTLLRRSSRLALYSAAHIGRFLTQCSSSATSRAVAGGRQFFIAPAVERKAQMSKAIALVGVSSALALLPAVALAQQGNSSSYGTVGWGPRSRRYRSRTSNATGITTTRPGTSQSTAPNGFASMGEGCSPSSDQMTPCSGR